MIIKYVFYFVGSNQTELEVYLYVKIIEKT